MPSYPPRTLGIAGVISALAGFLIGFGVILGPAALVLGWLALSRGDAGTTRSWALGALVLGALDTLVAIVWLATGGWS